MDEDRRVVVRVVVCEVLQGNKDLDTLSPSPPPPVRFISIWKATISGRKETLPATKSAIYNTNNLYLF